MRTYEEYLKETGEYGTVLHLQYPLVTAQGLPGAASGEMVVFDNGQIGQVFHIEETTFTVILFGKEMPGVGSSLVRTKEFASIEVGDDLLGNAVDPLGSFINSTRLATSKKQLREINPHEQNKKQLATITVPFLTGQTLVDMLIPLGRGQKELIIGDRKTGKSSFFLSVVKNQIRSGALVVYCFVGKNKLDAKNLYQEFGKNNLLANMVFVVTTSDDSPGFIYLAPYTAMTIAEYLCDKGKDVVVIMDDLTTHAKFYREIRLLAGSFPGRESYPGDIFYLHSKLMERAGNFLHASGKNVSITCLPVAETVEADLTGYISTNLMSMTDGHIFFDSNAFYNGRRPAINVSLSVTRVGRQTQTPLRMEIGREIMSFLTTYEHLQNYSHFGAELSQKVKDTLKKGDMLYKLFDQHYNVLVPESVQIVMFGLIWANVLDHEEEYSLDQIRQALIDACRVDSAATFFNEIMKADTLYQLLANISKHQSDLVQLWRTKKTS